MAETIYRLILELFVYGFFLLIALGLISLIIPNKPKPKGFFHFWKNYWSEVVLIIGVIFAAYCFLKGIGL